MSEANRYQLAYVAEVAAGTTPTNPVLQLIPTTGANFGYNKSTVSSNNLRADAQVDNVPVVAAALSGDVQVEYQSEAYNDFIAAAIRSTVSASMTNGVETPSFSLEEVFTDVGQYRLWAGMRVNTLALSATVQSIVTGSFGFIGTSHTVADSDSGYLGTGSRTALLGNESWNAAANIGTLLVDGGDPGLCFQQIDLNINNNIRDNYCLGTTETSANPYGEMEITGTLRSFFKDWDDLYAAMLAHSDVSLEFTFTGAEGDTTRILLPRIKLLTDAVAPTGKNTDVEESVTFQALPNGAGVSIQVDYTASP